MVVSAVHQCIADLIREVCVCVYIYISPPPGGSLVRKILTASGKNDDFPNL